MPKIFISYSHDSDEHRDFVRAISDRMREEGLDCQIDQYINGFPPEGWQRWMEKQIELADFVLLVCTPNYLKRYRGEERESGRGVSFESTVISQTLYDHYYHNTKFIPVIPTNGSLDHVPLPLKAYSCYILPTGYEQLYRILTGQTEYVAPKLGAIRPMLISNAESPKRIYSDRLPTVKGEFFGRAIELKLLDNALAGNGTRIIQFIAPGGTGKTKLLRHWLDQTDNIDRLIAWSFYSQGSSEDKQVSATPFFNYVFDKLGSTRTQFATDEDKGEHLADLLRQQRCVLVLDGLEPLQHAGKGMCGKLKDRAIHQLLKSLARHNNGLCIITTRIEVHELSNRDDLISHDLQNLTLIDGVQLLKSLEVHGSNSELEKAVREYGCHALALHLLGNALHTYLEGDVLKRDTLTELIGDYDDIERHAFKVMQAYSNWLKDTPELKLLQLLGLFDYPIETEVLQVLWQAQIPNLTADIAEKTWQVAIRDLREQHRLLAAHENCSDLLDCHPLIREYFGRQLREMQHDAWRQAHTLLYEYYEALPEKLYSKEFPDTLQEMQPLFLAVAHGCAAGFYQQVLSEVYISRIQRGHDNNYTCNILGAFSDDLATVAHFFTTPWHIPVANLHVLSQAAVLNWAGFRLLALGRLREALRPMQASGEIYVNQRHWQFAAQSIYTFSGLQLTLGNVEEAIGSGQRSIGCADQSGSLIERKHTRATLANALHQSGKPVLALTMFKEAEKLQQKQLPTYPYLYSVSGFEYCNLLLAQDKTEEARERAEYDLDCWINHFKNGVKNGGRLSFSLPKLTLGHAHLQQGDFLQASNWLEQAIDNLRTAGMEHYLPSGLLARAALYRNIRNPNHDLTRARQDLQEVFDIAECSGMRLHLTDYHLEMGRLLIAEKENSTQSPSGKDELTVQEHAVQAAKLIDETGYKRRLPELQELQSKINLLKYD